MKMMNGSYVEELKAVLSGKKVTMVMIISM